MENDQTDPPAASARLVVPHLPPRVQHSGVVEDVWVEPHPEPTAHVFHPTEPAVAERARRFMWPTTVPRLVCTVGWLGAAAASFALISALLPSFRDGDPNRLIIELDAVRVFGGITIGATLAIYLGWFAWTVFASLNARRLSSRTTSPLLPVLVYVGGPVLLGWSAQPGDDRTYFVLLATVAFAVAHLGVIASMRGSAVRLGGTDGEFTKLILLPIAWTVYRFLASTMVTFFDGPWHSVAMLCGILAVEALFPFGIALASYRAMEGFDHACRRVHGHDAELHLPGADVLTAALRQRALEGR